MRNLCTLLISLCALCVQGLLPESFILYAWITLDQCCLRSPPSSRFRNNIQWKSYQESVAAN